MAMQGPIETLGIVAFLMMRSPAHHGLTVEQIRKIVLPAMDNRLAITATTPPSGADGQTGGQVPLAFALFARVSDEWDAKLRDPDFPLYDMPPEAWTSGDNRWLVDVAAAKDMAPQFAMRAARTLFPEGVTLNLRLKRADGGVEIGARQI